MILALRDVTEDDIAIFYDHQLDEEENRVGALIAKDWGTFNANWDIDAPLAGRNRAGGDPHGHCEAAQGRTEEHPQGDHRRQEEADDRSFAEEDPDGAWEAGRRRGQAEAERRLDAAHTERAHE